MLTAIVQMLAAPVLGLGKLPLASMMLLLPAVAVTVPPQVLTTLGVAAIVCPNGKLSVKSTCVSASALATRLIVIVSLETPLGAMMLGTKDLLIGVASLMIKLPVAGVVLLPWFVTNAAVAIVLVRVPPIVAFTAVITGIVIVQLLAAGMLPPVIETKVLLGVAISVPPQVLLAAGLGAILIPVPIVFKLSAKLVIIAGAAVRLFKVMIKVDPLPCGALAGLNTLVAFTPNFTFNVAVAAL